MTVFQFIRNYYLLPPSSLNETHQWREQVLSAILFFVLALGSATAIPSIVLAISENLWSVVVVDIFALIWVATIWRLPFLNYRQRAWNFLLFLYLLGVWFLIKVGLTGLIYLMAFPVLTSLLLNLRHAMQALFLSALSLLVVGYLADPSLHVYGFDSHPFLRLVIVTINFTFIAAVMAISCGVLLQRLDGSLEQQRVIAASLQLGQSSLRMANEELRLIVAAVARLNDMVMIIHVDADAIGKRRLKIVFVNDAFVHQTGFSSIEVIDRSPVFLQGPRTQPEELDRLNHALITCESVHIELICYTRDGNEFWMEADVVPLANDAGQYTHWVATGRDISERKKAQEHIHRLAYFDVLTGLPNRRLLLDRMSILLATARRSNMFSAVLFIDLDHFKYINDARGHAVGDALLIQVAGRLSQSLREVDTVAHIGGDEFVVLLCHVSNDVTVGAHAAQAVAEKIRHTLSQFFDINGLQYNVTCSIGITLLPRENQGAHDLLREADTAMFRAKSCGRNQIAFYETGMQSEVEQRLTVERELSEAISGGQLQMHIQPQVDRMGKPVGGEMLMRWTHPERGPISPAIFIPVAEESGMILRLGDWVMEQGCLALLQLEQAGWDIPLSVNVSPKQFRQVDFVEKVKQVLKNTGAPPARLILEVTEGLLIDNLHDTIARMVELTKLGIRFSIDDFGTGYSSLAYLKKLPLYELKIDRSFVQDTPDDANDTAIVQSILSMASHLGLRVVAEGVETREQADFLIANGCASMQGFLFARPMPLDKWIAMQKPPSQPLQDVMSDVVSDAMSDMTPAITPADTSLASSQ
ncbi:putative bifunctional diguanylate cyclase/phosphodiesterase [Undibacterium sp. Di26W]|uniref:putative bifunctional diguanylate cyclase/phosphodiesterase n=1 Tax=Undibacterium sp. Di26W TaxID=3413035 RepID=UPI003BEFBBCC